MCLFSPPTQRMDLGECLKVHDLALRADYEIASKEQDFFFELDVCHFASTIRLSFVVKYFEYGFISLNGKRLLANYLFCDYMKGSTKLSKIMSFLD